MQVASWYGLQTSAHQVLATESNLYGLFGSRNASPKRLALMPMATKFFASPLSKGRNSKSVKISPVKNEVDERCCGTGTCIIDAQGLCWCGQQWDGEKMCRPALAIETAEPLDNPKLVQNSNPTNGE
jgi:hypothetical protein